MPIHKVGLIYRTDAGTIQNITRELEGVVELSADLEVPASTTNAELDLPVDISQIVAMCIGTNKAVTIKTNSTSAPDDTLTLGASSAIEWDSGLPAGYTKPLTVDVVKFYVTNAGTDAALIKFRFLVDYTPVVTP